MHVASELSPMTAVDDRLVIDVGMHTGEDTAFYLAKGFNVVAVEANPVLVAEAKRTFAEEIASGRLRIFGVAIAEQPGVLPLAVFPSKTTWSSLSSELVSRNENEGGHRAVYHDVEAVTFASILEQVGIPRYLKIDIEGYDMLCVRALGEFEVRPSFVSIETTASTLAPGREAVFDELATLWSLGYRRFAYVDQSRHPTLRAVTPPREGAYIDHRWTVESSGPFGEELPVEWESIGRTLARAELIRLNQNLSGFGGRWSGRPLGELVAKLRKRMSRPAGWYDLHATWAPGADGA